MLITSKIVKAYAYARRACTWLQLTILKWVEWRPTGLSIQCSDCNSVVRQSDQTVAEPEVEKHPIKLQLLSVAQERVCLIFLLNVNVIASTASWFQQRKLSVHRQQHLQRRSKNWTSDPTRYGERPEGLQREREAQDSQVLPESCLWVQHALRVGQGSRLPASVWGSQRGHCAVNGH